MLLGRWVSEIRKKSPKQHTGVCCVKSYVSKRKKRGYEFWGLVRFGGKLQPEKSCKRTNPPKRTHISYVSKRNFLHNTPLCYIFLATFFLHELAVSLLPLSLYHAQSMSFLSKYNQVNMRPSAKAFRQISH